VLALPPPAAAAVAIALHIVEDILLLRLPEHGKSLHEEALVPDAKYHHEEAPVPDAKSLRLEGEGLNPLDEVDSLLPIPIFAVATITGETHPHATETLTNERDPTKITIPTSPRKFPPAEPNSPL